MISHSASDSAEQRKFSPALHLQRYNTITALIHNVFGAFSVLDVGCSTCEFGRFVAAPPTTSLVAKTNSNNSKSSNSGIGVIKYAALDLHRDSVLGRGRSLYEDEMRSLLLGSCGGVWIPREAMFICRNVFDVAAPAESECSLCSCSSSCHGQQEQQQPECCFHAPHAECIVSLDVVEHIPLKLNGSDDNSNESGPAKFLEWLFHTAPCPRCTKAIIVTTPNFADNVPVLGMQPGELRHWDHKFEWTLEQMADACSAALLRSRPTATSTAAWSPAAWLQFGMGGTASQGVIVLQRDFLVSSASSSSSLLFIAALADLYAFDCARNSAANDDDNNSSNERKAKFDTAARLFAEETKFGTLLSFQVITTTAVENKGSNSKNQQEQVAANTATANAYEPPQRLEFPAKKLWDTLYDLVDRAAQRHVREKEHEAKVAARRLAKKKEATSGNDNDGNSDNDDEYSSDASSSQFSQEGEEQGEEEQEQEREAIAVPFSAVVADSTLQQEVAAIPLAAIAFLNDDDFAAIPEAIRTKHHAVFASLRRTAHHVRRVLNLEMTAMTTTAVHDHNNSNEQQQQPSYSITAPLASLMSKEELSELLWAAVDGFLDGAEDSAELGHRIIWV